MLLSIYMHPQFGFTNKLQNHHRDGSASRVLIGLAICYPKTVSHRHKFLFDRNHCRRTQFFDPLIVFIFLSAIVIIFDLVISLF